MTPKRLSDMRCAVFSHKICWRSKESPSGFVTDGGFPIQMDAISQIFRETRVVVPVSTDAAPDGSLPLAGNNLSVVPLRTGRGRGRLRRLLLFLEWLPSHLPQFWRQMSWAEALHLPIPGEVGGLALFLAWLRRKLLFVRHCGTWGLQRTTAERLTHRFLESIAGGRNVVLATGGRATPPSPGNPAIRWIFSTSLTRDELDALRPSAAKALHAPIRLATAARLEPAKKTDAVVEAVAELRRRDRPATLDVFGAGSFLPALKEQAANLEVADAVRFHGKVPQQQVIARLPELDIFCFPSTSAEGFPKAVLEALAAGLPVVAMPNSVLAVLIHDRNGRLISAPTGRAIADAVEALAANPAHYTELTAQAHESASSYSLESWRETIAETLNKQWGLTPG